MPTLLSGEGQPQKSELVGSLALTKYGGPGKCSVQKLGTWERVLCFMGRMFDHQRRPADLACEHTCSETRLEKAL